MIHLEAPGVLAGAIVLGFVHGIEPGHGWPVAAAYAMDRPNAWAAGFLASLLIGVGHLISSIAVVLAYFYAIAYFDLASLDDPVVIGGVAIGGPLGIVAGLLLIGLGIHEYYGTGHVHGVVADPGDERGHGSTRDDGRARYHAHDEERIHEHASGDDHSHDDGRDRSYEHERNRKQERDQEHDHEREHDHDDDLGAAECEGARTGWRARIGSVVPFVGGHEHLDAETARDSSLLGIAWVAFVLGFAHEEEFEIIALCTGSSHCLELMLAYAITVVVGIVGLTMLLVAGYRHFEERVERITPYLPAFSAAVLIVMGLGFVLGLL